MSGTRRPCSARDHGYSSDTFVFVYEMKNGSTYETVTERLRTAVLSAGNPYEKQEEAELEAEAERGSQVRSVWSRRRRGAVCPQGIFQLMLLELRRRGNAVKKIPSAQKLEKFWVLEKKVLDPAQTGRPQPLETPIPHGFGGLGPGSPEQILAAVGRHSFRFTDRWSASAYQTRRIPG